MMPWPSLTKFTFVNQYDRVPARLCNTQVWCPLMQYSSLVSVGKLNLDKQLGNQFACHVEMCASSNDCLLSWMEAL